ncbi:MAG: glycosyltransferase family 39 protein [Candidatus Limnocylindria bacterium]
MPRSLRTELLRPERPEVLLASLTLAVKLAVLGLGAASYLAFSTGRIGDPLDVLAVWNRWDAPHYLDLVVFGYRDGNSCGLMGPNGYRSVFPCDLALYIVFYPLFPWLATAVNAVVDQPLVSAFVVSSAASVVVAPLLYRLVRLDEGPAVALRAAWFLLIFPTAYFLHIGYTEALFMALVLGSFLAARTDRWWLAGLLGGLAALTRVNGLILVPALLAEAATRWYEQPPGQRRLRAAWLGIGLVLLGPAAYLALNQVVYGDPFTFLEVQRDHWHKSLQAPWVGIGSAFLWFRDGTPDQALMYGGFELGFTAIGLAATIFAALRFRPSWFAWMAGNWILFVSTAFLVSVPRYTLTMFPVFVAMAIGTRGSRALVAVSAVSLAGFVYLVARFASGSWAF